MRGELDRLGVPWCAILGDDDVHEKSFANFKEAVSEETHYAFRVGGTRFLAMNAFDVPEPPSFTVPDERVGDSHVWEADLPAPSEGTHFLKVSFKDAHGRVASDEIRLAAGQRTERKSEERDQDNALEAWPEHGLLGTQLGPNKNGKKR